MRPLPAGQQKDIVPGSSRGELRVNALLSNNTIALRNSSSARMNADRLPRDSAHPSGKLPSNTLPISVVRRSNSAKMSEKNKLTDSEHWSSKLSSGDVLQSDSAPRSESGRPSPPTRRYVPEPINQLLLGTSSCGKGGRSYPAINTSACAKLSPSIVMALRESNSQGALELVFRVV
jgi:hypothetical protein